MPSICVIGAGVSGLTTAIQLLRSSHEVSIIAVAPDLPTTSSAAAAFWYPFWTGEEPDHSWYRPTCAWETFIDLDSLVKDNNSGVTRVDLVEYFDAEMEEAEVDLVIESMWWRVIPSLRFRTIPKEKLPSFSIGRRRFSLQRGITFETLVVNMSCYLPFLRRLFLDRGGSIVERHLQMRDLANLCQHFDYVINCSGLGAKALVGDNLEPREGVVLHLSPVHSVKKLTLLHTGPFFSKNPLYIVPRGGPKSDIVIGGTIKHREGTPVHIPWAEVNNQRWQIRAAADSIYEACNAIEPALSSAEKMAISIGYRPVRMIKDQQQPVRAEPEFRGKLAGRLLHNYGHAGGGVTLSWGYAKEIDRWISWFENRGSSDLWLCQTVPSS